MAASAVKLPPGFVLEEEQQPKQQAMNLPPGFVLEQPQAEPPMEQTEPKRSVGGFIGNIPGSIAQTAQTYSYPLFHPIKTAKGMADLGAGIVGRSAQGVSDISNLLRGKATRPILGGALTEDIQKAEETGRGLKDRYGSIEALKKTAYEDPVGILTDAAFLLQGGGSVLGKAGGVAGKSGKLISKAAQTVNPVLQTGKLGGKLATSVATKVPQAMINTSSRIINSIIKPLKKDFSYGKNPGEGIVREGIIAKSFDDLADKVSAKTQELGKMIDTAVTDPKYQGKVINASGIAKNFDDAIKQAAKTPETNEAVIERLMKAKRDLLGARKMPDDTIVYTKDLSKLTPMEAWEIKKSIGEITKFTGNPSDDAIVNTALKRSYGTVKGELNKAIPELTDLNERFANMKSADIAVKYRDKILQRQNMINITPKIMMGGGGLGSLVTGNPAYAAGGLALAGAEKLLASTPIKTAGAQALYKTGRTLQKGVTGVKKVGEAMQSPVTRQDLIKQLKSERGAVEFSAGDKNIVQMANEFNTAVKNTQGAKMLSDGSIEIDISRFQKPEQFGASSIRTGVFYLPELKSPYQKYYSKGKLGYGGGQKVSGRTNYKNPLIIKAGTGGTGISRAYDKILGKGSYEKMRRDILDNAWTKDWNRKPDYNSISKLLEKYGGNPDLTSEIIEYSRHGNTLPYAIQEHIAAHAIRKAGYDGIISYSKHKGTQRLAEVFDVRAMEYPDEMTEYKYPEFYEKK